MTTTIGSTPPAERSERGTSPRRRRATRFALRNVCAPALCYLAAYLLLNPDAPGAFSHRIFLDTHDGYQNVWNIWWVNHAVADHHASPYFTTMLHWPTGVTLVPQTLSALDGFVGIFLRLAGLNLVEVVNTIIVGSFVAGGVTMFWLLRYLSASNSAAVLGGFLFTFSSYHAGQAISHLQLVSFEFIPAYVLAWLFYLDKPSYRRAAAAAGVLFAVLLCDYYYFFYCLGIAVIVLAVRFAKDRSMRTALLHRTLATFAVTTAATCGWLVGALFLINQRDPLLGAHHADRYGLDPLSLIVPGGGSYWNSLTATVWRSTLPISVAETSVYLGSTLIVGLILSAVWVRRDRPSTRNLAWWIVLAVFGVLSLGPRLRFYGVTYRTIPLPYAALEHIVPGLKLSGMPIRMVVVVVFAAVVIVTDRVTNMQASLRTKRGRCALVVVLAAVSFVELYPRELPMSSAAYPPYVAVLQRLPHNVGVIDEAARSASLALYYQTVHGMPMAYGYVTRLPSSVNVVDRRIASALRNHRYDELCSHYHVRYLATRRAYPGAVRMIYLARGATAARIYDLQRSAPCAAEVVGTSAAVRR